MTKSNDAWAMYASVFGLRPDATMAEVTAAYRALAASAHPDQGGDAERWTLVTAAFNELKRISQRRRGRTAGKSDESAYRHWSELVTSERPSETSSRTSSGGREQSTPEYDYRDDPMAGKRPTGQGESVKGGPRCGRPTKSGPCCRPAKHVHGCTSAANIERKRENAKARRKAV